MIRDESKSLCINVEHSNFEHSAVLTRTSHFIHFNVSMTTNRAFFYFLCNKLVRLFIHSRNYCSSYELDIGYHHYWIHDKYADR